MPGRAARQTALNLPPRGTETHPGDLAGGAGYVDQAHFGHELRAFTWLTPTR